MSAAHTWFGRTTCKPHPISETGYRSHFVHPQHIEEEGGPVAHVQAWLRTLDDGKPKQLSLL